MSGSRASEEQGGWGGGGLSLELYLAPRCWTKEDGILHASPLSGVPAQLGHHAVALPELKLAREVVVLESTVVRAIVELLMRAEVRNIRERRYIGFGDVRCGHGISWSPSARPRGKLASEWGR